MAPAYSLQQLARNVNGADHKGRSQRKERRLPRFSVSWKMGGDTQRVWQAGEPYPVDWSRHHQGTNLPWVSSIIPPETQGAWSEVDALVAFVRERHQTSDGVKNVDDYAGGCSGIIFGNVLLRKRAQGRHAKSIWCRWPGFSRFQSKL